MHLAVTRHHLARAAAVAAAGLAVGVGLARPASASSSPWTVVSTPNVRSTDDETISGVAAISGSDVWAVGQDDDPGTVIDGLIENWNGSACVGGVVELGPTDMWTTGNGDFSGAGQTLSMQWNGSAWSVVSTPSGAFAGSLGGIARVPGPDTLWTTGFQTANEQTDIGQTLALRNTSG
jgi:hypothetical protein